MTTSSPIVRVQNVSKVYPARRGLLSIRHNSPDLLRRLVNRSRDEIGYRALDNVSFDVSAGEGLAVIGRNGSGKTTLIRLMANIMRPTRGHITINARYAALIGLGTGFVVDMTGRDNIPLMAAMYGLGRDEVRAIAEDIIAFADIGDFIDHRVREYSSGMKARLGFSIAVHILPQVIMIDETLAVGDVAFREKCDARIESMLGAGRTLILVSHNMGDVYRLCQRAVWLDGGAVRMIGPVDEVVPAYKDAMRSR